VRFAPAPEGDARLPYSALGVGAGRTFDVYGKDAQRARGLLVRDALDRGIDLFATSPSAGEGERVLGAALIGVRRRAYVMVSYDDPDETEIQRQIDRSLHLFDGWIDLLAVDWRSLSRTLIVGMRRMRDTEDALDIGIACRTVRDLIKAAPAAVELQLDFLTLPATTLLHGDCDRPLDRLARAGLDVIARVPDGLESIAAEASQGERALNLGRYKLTSYRDVLFKLATSDPRVTAVTAPARRGRDLDALEAIAATPPLSRTEMLALRTA